MSYYLVSAAIDGPKHVTFCVEADSREAAADKANYADGTPVRFGEDTHGRVEHIVSVEEVGQEQRPEWTVIGVYTDTQNFTPFQFSIGAEGPRDAVARALARMMYGNSKDHIESELPGIKSGNLKRECERQAARIASVRPTYRLKPREHLYEISEFAA
ncbi:hypothetical protein [Salinibacter ruber]|uniref:Uncharacterized protein n=1 Tax=Salinibacter ruber TaxID=146919 RepID=A0AAW5P7G8_9BACT|nr:hypothetical protein [Salinibacter ruber]MCS4157732.1 hypothetical protein [Salinibacter ruber]